jgi:hypothetical protein
MLNTNDCLFSSWDIFIEESCVNMLRKQRQVLGRILRKIFIQYKNVSLGLQSIIDNMKMEK